jgi:AraC-like DNA-binding protein
MRAGFCQRSDSDGERADNMIAPQSVKAVHSSQFVESIEFCADTAWTYLRSSIQHTLEVAYWDGAEAPVGKPHFHDEAQLVFVIKGRRQFTVASSSYIVNEGECLYIPAGQLHESVRAANMPTQCLNFYVPDSEVQQLCEALQVRPMTVEKSDNTSDFVGRSIKAMKNSSSAPLDVSVLAASLGYGREGFTRKFSRQAGVGPAEFSLLIRLNRARALLRDGSPAASIAAECGFTDQSHMGRHFLRTFGTTPMKYSRA